ncbi:MAG: NAD-dependent epimerase/dehydratase family protein [Chloroflexi bacterium]|nr:NAD-dependent epimerase/dehydratase family protein [Chloroflexota bacterium]
MKVLFIGGTGTVSAACAHLCVEQGMDLFLLLRGTRDHRVPPKARLIHGDIRKDPGYVRGLLAQQTWDCVVDWVGFEEEDVLRDVEFFQGKTKKFVFISSTAVYRKPLPTPRVIESTPTGNKFWEYADKKTRCERLFYKFYQSRGFPVVIVRPGAVYAEFTLPTGVAGMGFGIADRILSGRPILVHGDGTGLWTFTFNEDFARGFVPLISLDSVVGETFHITSDEILSWIQIYDLIGAVFGREGKYVFASSHLINQFDSELGASLLGDKSHSYIFNNSKIKNYVPSFLAEIPLSDGLRRCETWYRQHKSQCAINPKYDLLLDKIIDCVVRLEPSGNPPQDRRTMEDLGSYTKGNK